ncbi:hypothetical protein FBU31_005054 [Coemansia sp. 'formosensis']|nr:hypothetical protein FBU31_005054 [Coemansia sp. 'formosensis']
MVDMAEVTPLSRRTQHAPHAMQRIVRIQLTPSSARIAETRENNDAARAAATKTKEAAGNGTKDATGAPIWLPSDVIDAISSAAVAVEQNSTRCQSMRRLGASPMLSDEAQAVLRKLSQVSRDWRQALLPRAWRSVQLTGTNSADVREIHAFAAPCVRRLVVPWGAMAAPVSWMSDYITSGSDDSDSDTSACSFGFSVDSHSRLGKAGSRDDVANNAAVSACRLRCVFGDQVWPAVEHLDMSFMPLICYQGIAALIRHTMPRLRSLRIGGFVPATALAEILHNTSLPLLSLEISGSVWANADGGRRGSASSWRSSSSTVAAHEPPAENHSELTDLELNLPDDDVSHAPIPQALPALSVLAVTADALRSPAVFAYVVTQAPTLTALHLLECDYKIMDMLRFGRMEERHMHAVEWATTQMVLHSQETQAAIRRRQRQRQEQAQPICWAALKTLHIGHYHMAPRENAGLRVHADSMPQLEQLVVECLEPSDSHHATPPVVDALQIPRLRGRFDYLTCVRAPVFDIRSLPLRAPALRSLCLTGAGGTHVAAMLPTQQEADAFMTSGLPLARVSIPN